MHTLTIKKIPDKLYQLLKEKAMQNHRSINKETIHQLQKSLATHQVNQQELLERTRKLRDTIKVPPLTDEFLKEAKNRGRP